MKILVIGGTSFFGIHMVKELLDRGHDITIATRGLTPDNFGDKVKRIVFQRTDERSVKKALSDEHYDVVIDKIAYCSDDIKYVMDAVDCDKYIYMSSTSVYDPKHVNTVETDFDGTSKELIWCDRSAFPYEQIKRQAEYALWQEYPQKNWIAVRYPFAIGKDDYVEAKTGARAVISNEGDEAPYNGEPEYSINTDQAKKLGYRFSALKDWIYELLDYYIKTIN